MRVLSELIAEIIVSFLIALVLVAGVKTLKKFAKEEEVIFEP
jgi:hypothetical protein